MNNTFKEPVTGGVPCKAETKQPDNSDVLRGMRQPRRHNCQKCPEKWPRWRVYPKIPSNIQRANVCLATCSMECMEGGRPIPVHFPFAGRAIMYRERQKREKPRFAWSGELYGYHGEIILQAPLKAQWTCPPSNPPTDRLIFVLQDAVLRLPSKEKPVFKERKARKALGRPKKELL